MDYIPRLTSASRIAALNDRRQEREKERGEKDECKGKAAACQAETTMVNNGVCSHEALSVCVSVCVHV